jgi:hypothetical protein
MPHKLNGLWRSLLLPDTTTGDITPRDDGQIFLRLDERSGEVLMGSNHNGKPLTGQAEDTADGLSLTLQQDEEDNVRDQSGFLISEEDSSGQKSLAVFGRYKDTAKPVPEDKGKRPPLPADVPGQEEGTWVITKP